MPFRSVFIAVVIAFCLIAFTGVGLLLIFNRMVPSDAPERPQRILLLALGGLSAISSSA